MTSMVTAALARVAYRPRQGERPEQIPTEPLLSGLRIEQVPTAAIRRVIGYAEEPLIP